MRYFFAGLLVALFAIGARAEEDAAAPAAHGPKIVCDEPVYDFGSVDSMTIVEHTFVLRNEGDTTLEIKQVRPSCGCTVAEITEKMVPPGGESRITAKLNLQGRVGGQHKAITVESNDPNQPNLTLALQGTATSAINVQPAQVVFQQIAADANLDSAIEVRANADTTFNIQQVEVSSPLYEANVETIEEGKAYRVVVKTKPPLPAGMAHGNVRIRTDSTFRPVIDVPIYGNVVADITVAPQEIILDAQDASNPVTRYVVVKPNTGKTLELSAIEPPESGIQVQVFPFGGDGFRIQLNNIVTSQALDGKNLRITTNIESMKEILIPFRIINANPEPHV